MSGGNVVPVIYKIASDRRTVRTECTGSVTLEEVIRHFQTLQQDPRCPNHLDVLLDLTRLDSLPETSELSRVVSEIRMFEAEFVSVHVRLWPIAKL